MNFSSSYLDQFYFTKLGGKRLGRAGTWYSVDYVN